MDRLPQSPPDVFIDQALLPDWDPSGAVGYDVQATPGEAAFVPVGQSLDDVGSVYPHITVQFSTESSPGGTTYNYIASDGQPGQDRNGQLLAVARAEAQTGYTGDPDQYDPVDADEIVEALIATVEDAAKANATAESTDISPLGSQRGADQPNDYDVTPPVIMASCTVTYHWSRD